MIVSVKRFLLFLSFCVYTSAAFSVEPSVMLTLKISNFDMSLVVSNKSGNVYEIRKTMQVPHLWGDPPSMANNDSPFKVMMELVGDRGAIDKAKEIVSLNKDVWLYISGAGYDVSVDPNDSNSRRLD